MRGAVPVARLFSGRAQIARPVVVNGRAGIVVAPLGKLFLVLLPTIRDGKIVSLEVIASPARLAALDLGVPAESPP